jgi:hypothetical protein
MTNKLIFAVFVGLLSSPVLAEPPPTINWQPVTQFFYDPGQVRLYGANTGQDCVATICNAIYVMTHIAPYSGAPNPEYGAQTPIVINADGSSVVGPVEVDLTKPPLNVSADAKIGFLTGMLIITHGTTQETADVHVTAAAAGQPIDCTRYLGQTAEASVGNGIRSNAAFFVPLNAGKFQFCYYIQTPGKWPTNSSYGINFTLQMWGR